MSDVFMSLFLLALCGSLALRLALARRQMRHIRRHRHAVPPDFAGAISLEAHQLAADYNCAKIRLAMTGAVLDSMVAVALTLCGGLDLLWALTSRLATQPVLHGTLFMLSVFFVSGLVSLPQSVISTFVIEARFGFNRMRPGLFVADLARGIGLTLVLGAPLLALVLWLMRAGGDSWWLWVWGVWAGFNLLMLVLYPTLIAPLFNRFTPLDDPALAGRIDGLLARCGFRSKGVFVMDGSRRSSHGNAYFTGFGAARRIVFFDTLLKQLDPAEIEAVLAHELGHFRLHHIRKNIAFTFLLSLALLWVLGQLAQAAWFYQGLGVHAIDPALALMLFFLVMPAFTFPFTPLSSLLSRKHEYEADAFAARETDAATLCTALVKMYRDNGSTLTPDPLHTAFYASHPPAALRIAHLKGL